MLRSLLASWSRPAVSRVADARPTAGLAACPCGFVHFQFLRTLKTAPKIKMKTHKGTAKRWTPLPSGQYKRGRPGKRHLNVSLTPARLNKLGETGYASPAQVRTLRKLLPGQ